jgi:hypothetical protein
MPEVTSDVRSDAILTKVRKLLAKAEDPACTPEEAEAFTHKAAQLIAKYGVDRALLAAKDPTTDPVGDRVVEIFPPYALDKTDLLSSVAVALRCRSIRLVSRVPGRGFSVHLFGFASDLERAELLFTSLLVQAAYGLAAARPMPGEQVAAFRRSWLAGFRCAVAERLRAAEERAASEATAGSPDGRSVALVLADRSDRVAKRVSEIYPELQTCGPRRLGGSGRRAGYVAGRDADLGGTGVSGRRGRAVGT